MDPHSCIIPGEILYGILASLSARELIRIRATSRDVALTCDSLLRTRLREFDSNPLTELVFESSAPSEYRSAGQQTIKLSGFVDDGFDNLAPKDVARFVLPVQMKQFLPLDDEEAFGSMLLSVHLRGLSRKEVEVEDDSGEGQLGTLRLADAPTASTTLPITMVAGGRPSFTNLPGRSSLPSTEFTFSLSVAEGLERLFRSWFEIPLSSTFDIEEEVIHQQELLSRTASSNTSTSFSSNVIKPTRPHTLFPSGSCALLEARIQCCQRKPTRATNSGMAPYAYGSPNSPDLPTLFEFFYTDLLLEVGKLVVSVEEGLSEAQNRSRFVFMMRI